jgi:hypothetical protein
MSSYDEVVGLDENYCSPKSDTPCNNVPCCEACPYYFEVHGNGKCKYNFGGEK